MLPATDGARRQVTEIIGEKDEVLVKCPCILHTHTHTYLTFTHLSETPAVAATGLASCARALYFFATGQLSDVERQDTCLVLGQGRALPL